MADISGSMPISTIYQTIPISLEPLAYDTSLSLSIHYIEIIAVCLSQKQLRCLSQKLSVQTQVKLNYIQISTYSLAPDVQGVITTMG